MEFKLVSSFKPAGDQPKAIKQLVQGIRDKKSHQVLLGATGTGKTFTIANVIAKVKKPVIVLSHNKTLAAQLYSEFKTLFPNNRVEYFISNFDYYRPEAYLPATDTYIDKTSKTNWDLEAMRLSALNALSTRRDTIIVASVAAIYGQMSPQQYKETFLEIRVKDNIKREKLLSKLVRRNYKRNNVNSVPGTFRSRGDVIEIFPSWTQDFFYRIEMYGKEIEKIVKIDTLERKVIQSLKYITIFPADSYTTKTSIIKRAIITIKKELVQRLRYFKKQGKLLEFERLEQRVNHDLESLEEFGTTSGIENYSRHLDGREPGTRPYTILDFMPKDSLMIIDESHMMIPQLHAMYNGDRTRKQTLVDYGFRLPSALDNRPLKFAEWEKYFPFQKIFISATPANYELGLTNGEIISQIIRPTGLLDPTVEVVGTKNQVEHIYDMIQKQKSKNQRSIILTISKKTAEELTRYFQEKNEKIAYIHSDHKAFERHEILRKLRKGVYDTIIGINLIREGIDLPEVSLIMVLDADKESFFRSTRSLIQIIGRAARNVDGHVIFYGDVITKSMKEAIAETERRRKIQKAFNKKHNIKPQTIIKPIPEPLHFDKYQETFEKFNTSSKTQKQKLIENLREEMLIASKKLNFEKAIKLRDIILELEAI